MTSFRDMGNVTLAQLWSVLMVSLKALPVLAALWYFALEPIAVAQVTNILDQYGVTKQTYQQLEMRVYETQKQNKLIIDQQSAILKKLGATDPAKFRSRALPEPTAPLPPVQ